MSPGQAAYEEDCRRKPNYDSGKPRVPWHQLDETAQWSWMRNPTPREFLRANRKDQP